MVFFVIFIFIGVCGGGGALGLDLPLYVYIHVFPPPPSFPSHIDTFLCYSVVMMGRLYSSHYSTRLGFNAGASCQVYNRAAGDKF